MRKKSHISLARHLVRELDVNELSAHQKAFCLGSILPDCKPSFLTKKHEFSGTFEEIKGKIEELVSDYELFSTNARAYCRHLGEVIHYIADYFTFPHNKHYTGNLKEHCKYEKYLKWELKDYIRQEEAEENEGNCSFLSTETLLSYIVFKHEEYREKQGSIHKDCEYIVQICRMVAIGILQLLNRKAGQAEFSCEAVAV